VKLVDLDNPVRASWLTDQSSRLDPGPYVSDTYAARMFLRNIPTEPLAELTERIFRPGIFKRQWTTSREHGIPFLSSADIFEADLSSLPMITKTSFDRDPKLPLQPGWTLITCSGMTAGRVTYARHEMNGYACSQDVLRVVANERIPAGYLYTFLASHYGTAMIKGGIYGTSVKHIEPPHLTDIPVPRFSTETEQAIHSLIWEAMDLRSKFQSTIVQATEDLFKSANLDVLIDYVWNDNERDLGFQIEKADASSLRPLNFSPRAREIIDLLKSIPHRQLGDICDGGMLDRGNRFIRRYSDSKAGHLLVGQRQGLWMRPEGKYVLLKSDEAETVKATDETVLISTIGSAGEGTSFCRSCFATGSWVRKFVYSEAFLRVVTGNSDFPGAYLFAFLRSEAAFRLLRTITYGSMQQYIHEEFRRFIPVPECTPEDRERIAETVRQAYRWRDEADVLEDRAFEMFDEAVREAAR
jgi:hypothetical protein